MASRKDIEAGRASVTLFIKNQLAKGLSDAGKQVMRFGGTIAAAGAAIVGPMTAAVSHFVSTGSALADMSARTGVAVGSLAELKFAAEQTGATLADVETAIRMQQKKGLGSNFDAVAAKIAAIVDPAERTQAAIEAWGKSGAKLLPMVNDLAALRKEAQDLGLVPTAEDVAMADKLGDAWDKVKSVMAAAVFNVGAALAPMLLPAVEIVKNIAVGVSKWVKENGTLFRTIALIGAGLLVAGTAIVGIGAGLTLLGTAASGLALLLSPTGLIVAGMVLLVAAIAGGAIAWVKFTESGQKAARAVSAALGAIKFVFDDIFNAITSGRWELAGTIMGASIAKGMIDAMVSAKESMGLFGDLLFGETIESAQDAINYALLLARGVVAKLPKADGPGKAFGFDADAMEAKSIPQRPSQTAMTTHQALALTFGQKQSAANRNEEKQLLKDIKMAIQQGDKIWLEQTREMLRELRKGRAVVGP